MILGCNGMVWLAPLHEGSGGEGSTARAQQAPVKGPATPQQREAMSKAANAVRLLASLSMNISPASVLSVCKVSRFLVHHRKRRPICCLWQRL